MLTACAEVTRKSCGGVMVPRCLAAAELKLKISWEPDVRTVGAVVALDSVAVLALLYRSNAAVAVSEPFPALLTVTATEEVADVTPHGSLVSNTDCAAGTAIGLWVRVPNGSVVKPESDRA